MNPPRAANEIHFRLAAAGRPLADNGRALGAWGLALRAPPISIKWRPGRPNESGPGEQFDR